MVLKIKFRKQKMVFFVIQLIFIFVDFVIEVVFLFSRIYKVNKGVDVCAIGSIADNNIGLNYRKLL